MPPKYKTISEKFGEGEFHPDAPKVDFAELLDRQFILHEAKLLKNFQGQFGTHDAVLMLLSEYSESGTEHEKFTTISSGTVVVERVTRCINERVFPILVTPCKVNDNYYNLK